MSKGKKVVLTKKAKKILAVMLTITLLLTGGAVGMNISKSAFDVQARAKGNMEAGNFELTVTPVDVIGADPYDYKFDATTFNATDTNKAALDTAQAYNTTLKDGETEADFITFADIKTAPGYTHVFGYKVENTGTLDHMNVSMEIKATYNGTADNFDNTKFNANPSDRISYTVYQADATGTGWTDVTSKITTGKLDDVSSAFGKVSKDFLVLDTAATVSKDSTKSKEAYYILLLKFEDDATVAAPTNNWDGDNKYKGAKLTFDVKIRAQQPVPDAATTPSTP